MWFCSVSCLRSLQTQAGWLKPPAPSNHPQPRISIPLTFLCSDNCRRNRPSTLAISILFWSRTHFFIMKFILNIFSHFFYTYSLVVSFFSSQPLVYTVISVLTMTLITGSSACHSFYPCERHWWPLGLQHLLPHKFPANGMSSFVALVPREKKFFHKPFTNFSALLT